MEFIHEKRESVYKTQTRNITLVLLIYAPQIRYTILITQRKARNPYACMRLRLRIRQ